MTLTTTQPIEAPIVDKYEYAVLNSRNRIDRMLRVLRAAIDADLPGTAMMLGTDMASEARFILRHTK